MKVFTLISILLISIVAHAQTSDGQIQFDLSLNDQPIVIGEKYMTSGVTDSIDFEVIRFYLSNVQFFQDEDLVFSVKKQHHLIDVENAESTHINWQSGYINFKLEGVSKTCPARKNRFQFHLGGYQSPFNNLQSIALPVDSLNSKSINITIAIDQFFDKINLQETYEVMSPTKNAVELAQLVASIFSISK